MHDIANFGRPIAPTTGRWRPLGIGDVQITGGFWGERQVLNESVIIAHAQEWMERVGWIANFDRAKDGTLLGNRAGREFSDSEIYKLMEAMAWEHGRTGSAEMNERFESLSRRVCAAQEPDGYLNTNFGRQGQRSRYSDFEWGHELYCYGHLLQAAVARVRTHGTDEFVETALRAADHVCREFGEGAREAIPGHPEIEVALVELGRAVGNPTYLRQARLFIERRGHGRLADIEFGRSYYQDDVPVREATVARGHAVRAMYLAAGAVDVAVESEDQELLDAVRQQVDNTLSRRTYLTGGMGSRHTGESFGEDFELPPDRSYSETCAGIAAMMVCQRLLLATGAPRFADMIERVLYNILATSVAEDGRSFFYANTLFRRTQGEVPAADTPSPRADSSLRAPWYDVSCCPTNIARTLASLGSLIATTSDDAVQIHQYVPARVRASLGGAPVELRLESDYPATGVVRIDVVAAPAAGMRLELRIPGWATNATVHDGEATHRVEPGYVEVSRSLVAGDQVTVTIPIHAQWVFPDPRIDAVTNHVAVVRGPRVYALESHDLGHDVGLARVDTAMGILDGERPEIFVRSIEGDSDGQPYRPTDVAEVSEPKRVPLTAYHRWGNRGPATMRVWLPRG